MMNFHFDISIHKRSRPIVAIQGFGWPAGKITLLFGESGIGKSILSKAAFGLLDSHALDITINGQYYRDYLESPEPRLLRDSGFFVFQEPSTHLHPLFTLRDQLREGQLLHAPGEAAILRGLWEDDNQAVRNILRLFPKPHRPSGGEKQRILLAMAFKKIALVQQNRLPAQQSLFIFDEPTGSLDNYYRNRFLDMLFDRYRQRPFTILLITHDYSMISQIYDAHPDLKEDIRFKELAKDASGGLALNDFSPGQYLQWLQSEKPVEEPAPETSEPLLRIKSGYQVFGKTMGFYRNGDSQLCEYLTLQRGEMIYLKAASGIGKTTLAKIIMGLQPCRNLELQLGDMLINQETPKSFWHDHIWGKKAGMTFQHADEALNLKSRLKDLFKGLPLKEEITGNKIQEWLGLLFDPPFDKAFLNKPLSQFSGGQKQRLNLLRTLSLDTEVLILDEPLNGLDFESIRRVVELLRRKQKESKGIILISHNEEIFESFIPPENIFHLKVATK